MNVARDFAHYSEPELQRWLHLRAIEWCAWPVFLSQPIVPLLLIWFPPVSVLVAVLAQDFFCRSFVYTFSGRRFASVAGPFVFFLRCRCALAAAFSFVA